ncbi:FkbM family methyltransferase [uncultured Roseobacter sp.]|uniref:FkbM family methyltransferase n=1 Tax=uncultured Roseobacter sp. TaxID=114847 RepID=UPI002607FA6D|nr:FkbM family methyltransferase [uncultured Roseobacter sp.]
MPDLSADEELAKLKRRQQRNMRHAHAKGLMQGILSMLKPGEIVLDCGANIGDVTGPLAATGAAVHAYEPDPYAFGRLLGAFKDTPNVNLHNAAVGVSSGTIKLMRAENFEANPKGASVKSTVMVGGRRIDEHPDNTIDVNLVDLPALARDLIDEHGEIAFLKMDIEGAELEVLETMLEQRLFDNIRLTVAETHEKKFRDLAPRFKALRTKVAERYPPTQVNLDWI